MGVRKKLRVVRSKASKSTKIAATSDDFDEQRRRELARHLVKIGGLWRYRRQPAEAEKIFSAPPLEPEERRKPKKNARKKPLNIYEKMLAAGMDKGEILKLVQDDPLPEEKVVAKETFVLEEEEEETLEEEERTRRVAEKADPRISLRTRQLVLLRTADNVFRHNDKFSRFIWRDRLGDTKLGYTIDLDDISLTKGVTAILEGLDGCASLASTYTEEETNPLVLAQEEDDDQNKKRGEEENYHHLGSVVNMNFTHGSLVYKLERTVYFFQMLGIVASMDVDWPPVLRLLLNWTTRFLDGHFYPLTLIHKVLSRRMWNAPSASALDLYFYRDVVKFVYSIALGPILLLSLFRLWQIDDYTDPHTTDKWMSLYVENWWRRGLPRSCGHVLLATILIVGIPAAVVALTYGRENGQGEHVSIMIVFGGTLTIYAWIVGITNALEKKRVTKKSLAVWVFVVAGIPAGVAAAIASTTFDGSKGYEKITDRLTAILVVGGTFSFYVWLVFVVLATAWRSHFKTKVTHNKTYSSIVLLKESIKAKSTLCFILLFLTYLPTCFYVLGAARPVYSAKVWTRHAAEADHEPLEKAYRHVACYFVSFPPRIRPGTSRARRRRIQPPGFASYAPHPYHPHEATSRVDCDSSAGVLIFTISTAAFFLYVIGLPLTVLHLTKTATTQLHSCEWWQNYVAAWRRFSYSLAACEEYSLEHVLIATARLWKQDTKKQAKAAIELGVATTRRILVLLFRSAWTSPARAVRFVFNYVQYWINGEAASAEKRKRKRTKVDENREQGQLDDGFATVTTKLQPLGWRRRIARALCGKRYGPAAGDGEDILSNATTRKKQLFTHKNIEDDIPRRPGTRLTCYRISQSKLFTTTVTVAVLMSMAPVVAPKETAQLLGEMLLSLIMTWILGLIFILEFVIKMIAFTPRGFFRSRFNILDFSLILLWLLDVAIQSGTNLSFLRSLRALKSVRVLRTLRMARTLRLLKLSHHIDPLFLAMRAWILRWIADTPPSNTLVEQMEKGAKDGMWRIGKSLPAKIERMKQSYRLAKKEYAISFDEFTRDHELHIENIDYVVDTSALGYLIRPFKGNASFWRIVLLSENVVFAAIVTWLRASHHPWAQCFGGAVVCAVYGIATTLKRPYMYLHERKLDEIIRTTILALLLIGCVLDLLVTQDDERDRYVRSALAIVAVSVIIVSAASVLHFLRVPEAIVAACQLVVRELDGSVLTLVMETSLDVKSFVMEDSNLGLKLIQQWDDLVCKQWFWPRPHPRNLLTTWQKIFHVKWAALRGMRLASLRTPTSQSILHTAMLRGEPEATAWILYHHAKLLDDVDEQRDSPVVMALKELAKTLLAHEKCPSTETAWKRAKLAEILLSSQIQHYRVQWSLNHFRALGDIAIPLYGELIQQLALAFDLRPPPGFVRVSSWMHYSGDIPNFLAQCFLACRDCVELPHCELGDVGSTTINALLSAMESRRTSITIHSNFFNFYPIHVVRFVAPYNRLRDEIGVSIARTLQHTHSLILLDLSHNYLGDRAGVALADAIAEMKAKKLATVSLAYNRFLAETGEAFARVIRENKILRSLDLSNNRLGPRAYWPNRHAQVSVTSSGASLCSSLSSNRSLTYVDLSNNGLGAASAIELEKAVRRTKNANPSAFISNLVALGFAGNALGLEGGKALARYTQHSSTLTRLDAARNGFGSAAGTAFAGSLKTNRGLVYLDLSQNCLGSKAGRAIALALRENETLTSLEAADNGFGPDVLRDFSTSLEVAPQLIFLGLAKNPFGVQSFEGGNGAGIGEVVGAALAKNRTLTSLDLSGGTCLKSKDVLGLLSGFAENRSLVHVNLDDLEFDDACVLQLTNSLDRQRRRVRTNTRPVSRGTAAAALMNYGGLAESRITEGLTSVSLKNCHLGARAGPVAAGALISLPNLSELRLAGNHMGSKLGEHIGTVLASMRNECKIKLVDLSRNQLGESGGLGIARAMEVNTSVTDLDLSNNGLTAAVGTALADGLSEVVQSGVVTRPAHCVRLNLAENQIGTDAARDLLFALRSSATRKIDLSRNGVGPEAGEVISDCLRRNTIQWEYLNLEGNKLGKDGANAIFWALRRNSSLTELLLGENSIGPEFGTDRDDLGNFGNSLAAALEHNYTLATLDLASNDISCECGVVITHALRENPSLTELDLQGNDLNAESGQAIAAKLSDDDCELRSLILNTNDISWEGGVAIADGLKTNHTLIYLDLSYNKIGSNGSVAGKEFADMICKNSCLRHLDLEGNALGREAGMKLAFALSRNNTLVTLSLRDNHFDCDVGLSFLENFAANTSIVSLELSKEEVGDDVCGDITSLSKVRATSRSIGLYDMRQQDVNQRRRIKARPSLPKVKYFAKRKARRRSVDWAVVPLNESS